ncbi:type II toxin-antitoxin system PemK/MazF family toxin [Euzebya tangerina]|uniref:type II toxin-antitoxin system PemK/MazF family toxin n=1 Tax=Euzebya tangerina TaxID=591198 RepID=UPI0013C2FF2E|nr:type II toxin-antitoxin system PemK/MazF family toxin [Euzebya tangerina]
MRAGDVLGVDFGIPKGSEAAFTRAAVVLTATEILEQQPLTLHVVPITSNTARRMRSELPLGAGYPDRSSVAQVHLLTAIPVEAVTDDTYDPVSATELAQIRELIADLLDIP